MQIWSTCTFFAPSPCVWHQEQSRHWLDNFPPKHERQSLLHNPHRLFLEVGGSSSNANEGGEACGGIKQDDTSSWLPPGDTCSFRPGKRVLQPAGRSAWRAHRLQAQDYVVLAKIFLISSGWRWYPWYADKVLARLLYHTALLESHSTCLQNYLWAELWNIAPTFSPFEWWISFVLWSMYLVVAEPC